MPTTIQICSDVIRDMHLDGTLCEQCGCYMGQAVGRPRLCLHCENVNEKIK